MENNEAPSRTELWGTIQTFRQETDDLRREIKNLRFTVRLCLALIIILSGIFIALF